MVLNRLAAILALLVLFSGCKQNMDAKTPEGAFNAFVKALKKKDKPQIYEMSTKQVKTYFDNLYKRINEKASLIKAHYPEDLKAAELKRIGNNFIDGAKSGRDLFIKLVSLNNIRTGTAVDIGLSHKGADIKAGVATFKTAAGEVFVFIKESDGVWRTDYLKVVQANINKSNLLSNFETVDKNIKNIRSLQSANFDVRKPEGAYNQLRKAFVKRKAETIYNLCSERCRKMFFQAYLNLMETSSLLKKIKKGALRKKLRKDYGLDVLRKASGPKTLFVALWSFEKVKVGLEEQAASRIKKVKLGPKGKTAVVITLAGQSFNFVKEKDGVWRTTDFEFPLSQTSLNTIQQNLTVLKNLIQRL